MSEFNNRWQTIAARARESERRSEAMPYGFATRVLALARHPTAPRMTIELAWQRLTFAALGVIAAILVLCAALELPHLRDRKPLEPGIENAVAQLVWSI